MSNIAKIPVSWTGGPGGPGVSVFYSDAAATIPTGALGTFFNAVKTLIPSPITWTIPNTGDIVDSSTGTLVGSWTQGTSTVVSASGSGSSYAAGSGAVVRWNTGGIVNGRRVRGRTFFVPVVGAIYSSGRILGTQVAVFQAAANALVASSGPDLRIWHRPTAHVGGSAHAVTAAFVPDLAAVLRSRRD